MTSEVNWGDGSGDKIYLTYAEASGDQTVSVSSDANAGSEARSKTVTFATGNITCVLTVSQDAGQGELPVGAIPCEMIFTDGYTTFIDSGIVPTRAMSFDCDATITKNNYTVCPIGYYINNKRFSTFYLSNKNETGVGYNNYHNYGYTFGSSRVYEMMNYKVTVSDTGSSILITDGDTTVLDTSISYDETSATFSDTYTLGLLGRKNSNNGLESGIWRGGMGRTKIYSDDHFGSLIADYIPCYYNGNYCFYDKVSETFLYGTTPENIRGFGVAWNTKGFLPNLRVYTTGGRLYDYRNCCLSPAFSVPSNCTQIRFRCHNTTNSDLTIGFWKPDGSYSSYYTYNAMDRVVSVSANARGGFVRLSAAWADIDNCYIYDVTNGQYIWKGINVI